VRDPFYALRQALNTGSDAIQDAATPDFERDLRTGIPEVILAEGKDRSLVLRLIHQFLEQRGRAIVSHVRPRTLAAIQEAFRTQEVQTHSRAHMVIVRHPGTHPWTSGGRVGLVTAGSSDLPVAEEAQVIATEMGCDTLLAADVGVAGLHRMVPPLIRMAEWGADALIVVAGMDGALPSVVAGLVDVPVVGLPTSRGYGMGGEGQAALLSMLQTCVPGLTVVNVDNGVGAGASAARIANRVAAARGELVGRSAP
jgi:NCAIR mutase (PurE)-related protein